MTALKLATAYPAGEYVGQESFMRAGEVRPLTEQERARMPGAGTVWLIELAEWMGVLREVAMVAEKQ